MNGCSANVAWEERRIVSQSDRPTTHIRRPTLAPTRKKSQSRIAIQNGVRSSSTRTSGPGQRKPISPLTPKLPRNPLATTESCRSPSHRSSVNPRGHSRAPARCPTRVPHRPERRRHDRHPLSIVGTSPAQAGAQSWNDWGMAQRPTSEPCATGPRPSPGKGEEEQGEERTSASRSVDKFWRFPLQFGRTISRHFCRTKVYRYGVLRPKQNTKECLVATSCRHAATT